MSIDSPTEIAGRKMVPTWNALHKVIAQDADLTAHLKTVLAGAAFDAAGMTTGLRAMFAFVADWQITHGPVPSTWDLVQADRKGELAEFVAQSNAQWAAR